VREVLPESLVKKGAFPNQLLSLACTPQGQGAWQITGITRRLADFRR
jgi:hypothetical protein